MSIQFDKDGNRIDEFGRVIRYCNACKCKVPHIKGMCMACKGRLEQSVMYSQIWRCNACKATGAIMYKEDTEAKVVVMRIIEDHRNKTVLCPGRPNDIIIYPPMDKIA